MNKINWAIIAPGKIAHRFADALNDNEIAVCHSVCSRSIDRAQAFAIELGFEHAYTDIDEMLIDPSIDVVYIASPHHAHHTQSLKCLSATKAVLCEKPMAVNAQDAKTVINQARASNTFYMEAVWTRFLPIYCQIRQWLDDGIIGEVRLVKGTFGIQPDIDNSHRLLNAELAGGSILDLGIYPISLADWVYNETPISIKASAFIGPTGVDEQMAGTLEYSGGHLAQIDSAVNIATVCDAFIYGSKGHIHIKRPFWGSENATLVLNDCPEQAESVTRHHRVNGFEYEIEEVQNCLQKGLIESPLLPWKTSMRVMSIMDEIRSQIGLTYPFE